MKQLVEASGVHRQTVHSYLREGLLPGPLEGAGTRRARYGDVHVALLELLLELRGRGLSLEAIRRCFEDASFDPARVRRALSSPTVPARPALSDSGSGGLRGRAELIAETSCPDALFGSLQEAGVLRPTVGECFDDTASRLLDAVEGLTALGLEESTVLRLARLAQGVGAFEASALATDFMQGDGQTADALRRAEDRHRRIAELVSAVRLHAVRQVVHRLQEVGARSLSFAREAIYIPSPLFVKRHRVESVIERAEGAAIANPGDPATWKLGKLLMGVGRYAEAEGWLLRCVEAHPQNSTPHSYLGLAQCLGGRTRDGVEACRRAVALGPESPRAHAFLGAALALHAASTSTPLEAADVLREGLQSTAVSVDLAPADLSEHMETLLARGRLFTVLPSDMPRHARGVTDLEEVLRRTDGPDADVGSDFPGSAALYRVHALFYLGISARQDGDRARATRFLEECITLDPGSRFAERSYEILGGLG